MLDKVSKLLAQAENAGTPEEAEVFMAKVQELATTNGIDLAIARMHQAKKERVQEPEERSMQCNPYNRRHNRKHFIELGMAICDVNDVEYLIGGREYKLHMVGFPSDLEMVEALYTHLSIQMVVECDEALKRGDNRTVQKVLVTERVPIPWGDREWGQWNGKQFYDENPDEDAYVYRREGETDEEYEKRYDETVAPFRAEYEKDVREGNKIFCPSSRNWEGGYRKPVPPPAFEDVPVLDADDNKQYVEREVSAVDGRVFRSHFYEAFVMRMRGRLWEIRRSVERDRGIKVEGSTTALALRDKKEEVKKAHADQRAKVGHVGTYRSASDDDNRKYDYTGKGRRAGTKSAERVPIDSGREVKS